MVRTICLAFRCAKLQGAQFKTRVWHAILIRNMYRGRKGCVREPLLFRSNIQNLHLSGCSNFAACSFAHQKAKQSVRTARVYFFISVFPLSGLWFSPRPYQLSKERKTNDTRSYGQRIRLGDRFKSD